MIRTKKSYNLKVLEINSEDEVIRTAKEQRDIAACKFLPRYNMKVKSNFEFVKKGGNILIRNESAPEVLKIF